MKNFFVFSFLSMLFFCAPLCSQETESSAVLPSVKSIHHHISKVTFSTFPQRASFFDVHNYLFDQAEDKMEKVLCNPDRYFNFSPIQRKKNQSYEEVLDITFKRYKKFFERYDKLYSIFLSDWVLSVYAITGSINLADLSKEEFKLLEDFFQKKKVPVQDFKTYHTNSKGTVITVQISHFQIIFFTDVKEIQIKTTETKNPQID